MSPRDPNECCPRFDPEPWDEKEIQWQEKLFVRGRVRSFLHIPLNFGRVMVRDMEMIQKAGALADTPILLCDENSLWGADVYIAVTKDIPNARMAGISGTFLSKVFEGPFRNIRKWIEEMKAFVQAKGKSLRKLYFYYTTCPKCARVYGKNYVVILADQ